MRVTIAAANPRCAPEEIPPEPPQSLKTGSALARPFFLGHIGPFVGISLDEPVSEAYDIRVWNVNSARKNGAYGACPFVAR